MDFSQLTVSIDAQRNGAMVIIRPRIENPAPLTLQYHMTVRQSSANGTSSINQQGDVQTGVAANSVSLSIPTDGTCRVHLQVFEQARLLKEIDSACARPSAE